LIESVYRNLTLTVRQTVIESKSAPLIGLPATTMVFLVLIRIKNVVVRLFNALLIKTITDNDVDDEEEQTRRF
jgi:hypothetical protein